MFLLFETFNLGINSDQQVLQVTHLKKLGYLMFILANGVVELVDMCKAFQMTTLCRFENVDNVKAKQSIYEDIVVFIFPEENSILVYDLNQLNCVRSCILSEMSFLTDFTFFEPSCFLLYNGTHVCMVDLQNGLVSEQLHLEGCHLNSIDSCNHGTYACIMSIKIPIWPHTLRVQLDFIEYENLVEQFQPLFYHI